MQKEHGLSLRDATHTATKEFLPMKWLGLQIGCENSKNTCGSGRAGRPAGRVAETPETEIFNRAPSRHAQEKNTPFGETPHSDKT